MSRSDFEREIVVRLFQTANSLQVYLDNMLKEHNLTAKQFFLMIIIGSFESEPSLKEVSERFGSSHQNVKQILNKLVKQNYIELKKDKSDSRITRIFFTQTAHSFWDKRNQSDDLTMHDLFRSLSITELNVFKQSLIKTLAEIESLKGYHKHNTGTY